jgi:uncharacterized protein
MKLIFVDTGAWVALNNSSDKYHFIAVSAHKSLLDSGYFYITSNYVLDETYTFLLYNTGHKKAVEFGTDMTSFAEEGAIQVIQIDEELQKKAWTIFESYSDKDFSFTDCTSFAICDSMEIKEAFSFDKHFEQYWIASLILEEILSEKKWELAFSGSPSRLENLARSALQEIEAGEYEEGGF